MAVYSKMGFLESEVGHEITSSRIFSTACALTLDRFMVLDPALTPV